MDSKVVLWKGNREVDLGQKGDGALVPRWRKGDLKGWKTWDTARFTGSVRI
jgi:hypothetical protein